MALSETFFIVWNPKGPHSPRERHYSQSIAEKEARRLALDHPGHDYFVMMAAVRFRATEPVEIERFATDEIPF
ncbi:hypothetical protein [Sphingopyxis sp. PET50]|uniref:hypothetical protein n=1 Tax=Sphingopyxis sp. PET50 TaxID=2976533 RepID=UPI0021AFE0AC|nr:hypothetical protein [Sphingopyxis sp. PET50]